ncbi:NrfD/PsrC family molybdoenzyme membrane anchor subunit [uncultured Corynebacterium sp.]|uniref:NrfD/PsrC family molybdoenzyme membrane anchor subunit n=1 Tax=uncultured Corynebacterium sp. TaxID=159447 RepID=UPI0025DFE1BC|nr:NrfD/PsrC family molybdoenzyme membrane anchor subunit [uncultured Corynebacterium sp.]
MLTKEEARHPKPKRRRRGGVRGAGAGAQDGSKEERMAGDFQFTDYYGKPVVKAPPWEWPIGVYLFLGGVAGGSGMLAAGAQATGNAELRRNTALTAFTAAAAGSAMLVLDLGRPERLLNMFRVFKLSSPMSVGSWILGSFAGSAALPAAAEAGKLVGLPDAVQKPLNAAAGPAGIAAGVLGGPLASYTAVLLGDTSNPTWSDTRRHLPYVFASSAALASSGVAMATSSTQAAAPARVIAPIAAACDLAATRVMEKNMQPETVRHLHEGRPGALLRASEYLVAAGGIGAVAATATKSRALQVLSGLALAAGSCCTRFGVFEGGLESAKDPQAVIGPQKRRAEARRAQEGLASDVVSTARPE